MKPRSALKESQSVADYLSPSKDQTTVTLNLCKLHKDQFSMICLHGQCQSNYKLLCLKCKKQKHYQHPNRVINLKDFYDMLGCNRMDFIENSLALTLVNIKTKLMNVSNFRVFILEKEAMLMENARTIHSTIHKILEQKTHLKSLLDNINDQTQIQNTDALVLSLQEIKKHITFNPIQNVIRITPQKMGYLKVELQKHCESTKTVINDIRQYLVKIVEVMLEQEIEEEDIEYIEHEDVDEKVFNINVKKANHIEINEKQLRYKTEELKEMFDALLNVQLQKNQEHIENDVLKLQEEIKIKQQIVKNIRSRSVSKALNYSVDDEIKETSLPSGKHSLSSFFNEHHSGQVSFNSSKMTLTSPKNKDGAKDLKVPKNVNRQNYMQSPKSPKPRSITDMYSTSPAAFKTQNVQNKQQSGFNKRTPQNNFKTSQKDLPQSDIKVAKSTQEEKNMKSQGRNCEEVNELILEESQCGRIEESEEEQLLNTDSFNYEIKSTTKNNKKGGCFKKEQTEEDLNQESLLLDRDSPEKIDSSKLRELAKRVKELEAENNTVKSDLSKSIKEFTLLQKNHLLYKEEMEAKYKKLQQQLKDSLQKGKIDSIKQIKQTVSKQNKFSTHLPSSPTNNKEKRSPQKQEDKLLKKTVQENAINTKKLMDQKKQLEIKIQKQEKQIKDLKEKEANFKKQHAVTLQNLKELDKTKKKNDELSKKNEELLKKNEQLLKKNEQVSKKNEQTVKKHEEGVKRNEEASKKIEQMNKKNDESSKKLVEANKKLESEKQKHQEQMKSRLNDLSKQVEKKISSLQGQVNELKQKNHLIEERNASLEQHNNQANEQIQSLKNQISSLQKQIQKLQKQKKELQNIIQEQENMIRTTNQASASQTNNAKDALSSLQSQLNNLQSQKSRLQKTLQETLSLLSAKQSLLSQTSSLLSEKSSLLEQTSSLLQEKCTAITSLQQKLTQQEQAISQQDQIIRQQEISIKKQLIKIGDLQKTKSKLQTTLKDHQATLKNYYTTLKNYQTTLKDQQNLNQTHLTQIQQKHERILTLNQTLTDKQTQINQLNSKHQQIESTLKDNQKLITSLQKQNQDLNSHLQQIQSAAQMKLQENIRLKDQNISQLSNQLIQLSNQLIQKEDNLIQHSDKLLILQGQIKTLLTQNNQLKLELKLIKSTKSPSKQPPLPQQSLINLQNQLTSLQSKYQKLEEHHLKLKQSQLQQKKDHEKIKTEMLQQCQFMKKKYEEEKDKNQQTAQFDIKNYIPLLKFKQLKEWYDVALRKNQELKGEVSLLKDQKSQLITEYQNKLTQLNQQNKTLKQNTKTSFSSQSQSQSQESLKIKALNKQSTIDSSSNQINAQNSPVMLIKHTEIRSIIEQITGDMQLLEEKVKENTVIQKVYLKELDRKRTENRKLRQEVEEYRNRERKLTGVRTDRYYEKTPLSKPKIDKQDYKIHYATGFPGSESKMSGTASSLIPGNHYHLIQDHFTPSESLSTLSNNSNHPSSHSSKI